MNIPYRLLHRVMGVCLAAPLLLLVVSGVPLQFTAALNLGSVGVPFQWVHRTYGISVPVTAWHSGEVQQVGDVIFFTDGWQRVKGKLLGARQFDQAMVVATSDELLLVGSDPGVPIELSELPGIATRFGITGRFHFVVESSGGLLHSEDYGINWSEGSGMGEAADITWMQAVSSSTSGGLARRYGAVHVTWERWLQDLHTGRFFGPVGTWIMNLAGFVFMLLGFTGLVLWYTSRKRADE